MQNHTPLRQPMKLYTCFHLNLAFSSIEGRERGRVLRRCYWPLLELVRNLNVPVGIEANASTLEMIEEIDPEWIQAMRALMADGLIEFVGSGFVQLIGPLVPAEINRANFRIGQDVYQTVLGSLPRIAMVNEHAYSSGLVPLYKEAGFEAIIMDWANPFTHHTDWDPQWLYAPQKVRGADGSTMNILWNDSIPFQKFQRYVYGEMTLEQHIAYLKTHLHDHHFAFPLYGSDTEIFNFRPNRYSNEELVETDEWERIGLLFKALIDDPQFEFATPSQVLADVPNGLQVLSLESPGDPIPVKKQPKYNVTRWAVSGRDDLRANTACWQLYEKARHDPLTTDTLWRSICLKWRSDYRTHITQTRWNIYCWDMSDQFRAPAAQTNRHSDLGFAPLSKVLKHSHAYKPFEISQCEHFITIKSRTSEIVLNLRRGMAIQSYVVPDMGSEMIFGTLPHGFYADINWSADYYSGHLVAELAGRSKVCDLEHVQPEFQLHEDSRVLIVSAEISSPLGRIHKTLTIYADQPKMDFNYELDWPEVPPGNLRVGHITINPRLFDRDSLFYETHNGGFVAENHSLARVDVDHGGAVSFATSAQSGLGMTEGTLILGDSTKAVEVTVNKDIAAMIGMVTCKKVNRQYFCRVSLSAREMDDTSRAEGPFISLPHRNQYASSVRVIDLT